MTTLVSATKERMKVLISGRIPDILVIVRKGLKTLTVRKNENFPELGKIRVIRPVTTTTKSSQFHGSLRYECLCRMKPLAMIFMTISAVKQAVKKISVTSSILSIVGQSSQSRR